jgi:hypothetical protein
MTAVVKCRPPIEAPGQPERCYTSDLQTTAELGNNSPAQFQVRAHQKGAMAKLYVHENIGCARAPMGAPKPLFLRCAVRVSLLRRDRAHQGAQQTETTSSKTKRGILRRIPKNRASR